MNEPKHSDGRTFSTILGNMPSDIRSEAIEDGKRSLKKKKSLPKLFILSRRKSTKAAQDAETPSYPQRRKVVTQDSPGVPVLQSQGVVGHPLHDSGVLVEIDRNIVGKRPSTASAIDSRKTSATGTTQSPWGKRAVESGPSTGNSSISPLSRNPTRTDDLGVSQLAPQSSPDLSHSAYPSTTGYIVPQRKYAAYKRPSTASSATDPSRPQESPDYVTLAVGSARRADFPLVKPSRPPIPDSWLPAHGHGVPDQPRESVKSGMSVGSSAPDTTSTQRSSIFTKMSCISDTSLEMEDGDDDKDGMTVDEAIDLYSAGFDEEFDIPKDHPMKIEQDVRQSQKAVEAVSDSIDGVLVPPRRKVSLAGAPSSVAIVTGDVFHSLFPDPPPVQPPTATHDQYGFRKASRDVTVERYDAWWADYAPFQKRRTLKWVELLHAHGLPARAPTKFPPRSAKVQRFVRKGVPPAWRGAAWFHYAGGHDFLWAHPGHYAALVLKAQTAALAPADKEAIERDLHRTFPDNIHFKPDPPPSPSSSSSSSSSAPDEMPLLSALRRVLAAFAVDHPRIGYCQSLNFVAGLLLLFLPEEKAFWLLHIITTQYLPGTHDLSLEGANVDVWALMLALRDAAPATWAAIGGGDGDDDDDAPNSAPPAAQGGHRPSTKPPPVSLCTTSWFMSLFIGTLPPESVLRVWDVLFYDGAKTLFRVALAVFRLGEPALRAVSDPVEAFPVVQGLPRRMLDARALLETACARGALGRRWIEKKRAERRAWYAAERRGEKRRKESRDAGRKAEEEGGVASPGVGGEGSPLMGEVVEGEKEPEPAKKSGGWWPRLGTKKANSQ